MGFNGQKNDMLNPNIEYSITNFIKFLSLNAVLICGFFLVNSSLLVSLRFKIKIKDIKELNAAIPKAMLY